MTTYTSNYTRFEVLKGMLLRVQNFWNVTLSISRGQWSGSCLRWFTPREAVLVPTE
jgi:hypothetical protein